jgi:hypothetical protein
MTASWDDPQIARLVKEHGFAGYGLWWRVSEVVGANIEGTGNPEVTYSVTRWAEYLGLRGSHVMPSLKKLLIIRDPLLPLSIDIEFDAEQITVRMPHLVQYRDDYARKARHRPVTPEEQKKKIPDPPVRQPIGPEKEKRPKKIWYDQSFGDWYQGYWNHTGRAAARKAYEKAINVQVDREHVKYNAAKLFLEIQRQHDQLRFESTEQWEWRQNLHPATWLNGARWTDELRPAGLNGFHPKPSLAEQAKAELKGKL